VPKLLVDIVIVRILKKSYTMCTAVYRATSQTSHLPVQLITSYPAPFSMLHFTFVFSAIYITNFVIPVNTTTCKVKGTGPDRPWGLQEVAPRFQDNRHMKVVRLSALRTSRLYTPGNIAGPLFCQRLNRPQCNSQRIMSMKNSSDTIWNRTPDLTVCSAESQPTALPRAPYNYKCVWWCNMFRSI
jgi:hypothetical protein